MSRLPNDYRVVDLTKHLRENNVSYFQHMKRSLKYSRISACASLVFIAHAFLPFIFETRGSEEVQRLQQIINSNKVN